MKIQNKKLLIWTSGSKLEPSRRYRLDCYIDFYRQHSNIIYFDDISLSNLISNLSRNNIRLLFSLFSADIIFLQRRLLPIFLIKILKFFGKKIIFDVDDGIHLYENYKQYDFQSFKSLLSYVITGNKLLEGYWSKKKHNCIIIPTGVEYNNYKKRFVDSEQIELLWIGTKSNFNNLYIFYDYLKKSNLLTRIKLTIVSDTNPSFANSKFSKFKKWHEGIDDEIANSNVPYVGLMPLNKVNEVNYFKCSFKMLQYMNWSMPVIVSPLGMNKELIDSNEIGFGVSNLKEFSNAINLLFNNSELYQSLALCGNQLIKSKYSRQILQKLYLKTFKITIQ